MFNKGLKNSEAKLLSVEDRLKYILDYPERVNTPMRPGSNLRSRFQAFTDALFAARDALPYNTKEWRALHYVSSHPDAVLVFGGNDAVGPAIRKAIKNMEIRARVVNRHTA